MGSARAPPNGFNFGTDPFHTEDPFQWKLCFMYLYVNTYYIIIYIHIYIHIYIYIYVCEWICPIPSHQNLGYPVMGPGLEGTS